MSCPADAPGVAVAFVATTVGLAAVGSLLGALLPAPRTAQAVGPMLFVSGTGQPREVMSRLMLTIGECLPLSHAAIVRQDLWLGLGWNSTELLILATATRGAPRVYRWK